MENKRCQFGISVSSMIVGNPKAGRAMATIAIALFFLILLTAAFVCWRKRTDPEKEPPLHPSTLIAALRYRLELGEIFHNCASAFAASDSARFSAST
jgi:hypothetical protein